MGVEQFSYETFTAVYNADERIKKIVKNYNENEVNFVQDATDALPQGQEGGDEVGQMAKRATDVGAKL